MSPGPGDEHLRVLVEGLKPATDALRQAPKEVQRQLPRALKAAAEPAKAIARAKAPERTGRLAATIGLRARTRGKAPGVLLGSSLAYAPVLEFAHRGRYKALTESWGRPPRFLIPAVEEAAPEVEKVVGAAVQEVLDRAFPEG